MSTEVRVWDPLVRIFHWTLVVSFIAAYLSGDEIEWLHTNAGYIILGLLCIRIVWGIIGSQYARFSDFVYSPAIVKAYLKDLFKLQATRYLGHNPAGGYMVVTMMILLLLTTLSGMTLYGIDEGEGPFSNLHTASHFWEEVFEEIHEFFSNLTLLMVFIHILGVMLSSALHNENLTRAMASGKKSVSGNGGDE
ncbi:MAG: cytochrome b/b6 domain-containing protein [Gammaproteobacteria bacterium]|nr:cytochrome b/b6 domain-containing protein [Gammaproteobacteria bacterium]